MTATAPAVRKFNPGTFQSDAEVIEQFVVRHREFNILMGVLRQNTGESACQHMLLIAPRGRGKTMMLARVAAELRTSEALRRNFLPVRFMEESYEVFDLGDFWLDALFHLAPEVERHDAEMATELREAHAEFSGRWRGRDLEEHARAVVLETAERLGRKIVLMVENCQSLFDAVDERFGWGLRKTLQTEPDVIFLGTATARMAALDDVQAPFYEFFRPLMLAPLPLNECKALWEAASGDVRTEREIRPLQILTGGDPRLLVIIAGFARHRSLNELLQELVALIDDHTEYFRSHLEGLGKTERRVYIALIDLWRPSTTAEIAARSMQEIRTVSSLLGRLVKRGAVAYEGTGQKRLYSATQRLYSIYYKLRRQRDEAAVVHSLIQWMMACFTTDELSEMSGRLVEDAIQSRAVRDGLLSAFRDMPAIGETFSDVIDSIKEAEEARELTDRTWERMDKAWKRMKGVDAASVIAHCDSVVQRFGHKEALSFFVGKALATKGLIHRLLENHEDEIAAYDDLIGRFRDCNKPILRFLTCWSLANRGRLLGARGRFEAALETFSELKGRFAEDNWVDVRTQVADALLYEGSVWAKMGKNEEAVAAWDQLVTRYSSEGKEFQRTVATALFWKSIRAVRMGDRELALATCIDLVKRFHDSDDPATRNVMAATLPGKAELELQINCPDDALETIEDLVGGLSALLDSTHRQWVGWTRARALLIKGERKLALEALRSAYDNLIVDKETPGHLLHHMSELIGCGLAEDDLLEILTSDPRKCALMAPIVTAVRQRMGESVRVPVEVLEVAQDLAIRLDKAIERASARVKLAAANQSRR